MKNFSALLMCLTLITYNNPFSQGLINRTAKKNVLYSERYPHLQIEFDASFTFSEHFDFVIKDVADCERFIFIDATPDKKIDRLFIAQFESILPVSDVTYNYNFKNAIEIDGLKFRNNLFAFSNKDAIKNNPEGEAAKTFKLLEENGFVVEDKWITSRFVTVPDKERKHELIIFYVENLSETSFDLNDLYDENGYTEIGQKIAKKMKVKALGSFTIHNLNK